MIDPKFNFKDITTPKAGLVVYTDSYRKCENGDPTRALFYGDSPQCNRNKAICEHTAEHKMYKPFNIKIVYVPVAFVPQR